MIQALIQSRLPAVDDDCGAKLHAGDCFVIGDGGKHDKQALFHRAFVDKSNDPNDPYDKGAPDYQASQRPAQF